MPRVSCSIHPSIGPKRIYPDPTLQSVSSEMQPDASAARWMSGSFSGVIAVVFPERSSPVSKCCRKRMQQLISCNTGKIRGLWWSTRATFLHMFRRVTTVRENSGTPDPVSPSSKGWKYLTFFSNIEHIEICFRLAGAVSDRHTFWNLNHLSRKLWFVLISYHFQFQFFFFRMVNTCFSCSVTAHTCVQVTL